MKENGKNNPPLLIYDSNENYILNAPETYIYFLLVLSNANIRRKRALKKHRCKSTALSTDPTVCDQIRAKHLDVWVNIPCVLTSRAGIVKTLILMIIYFATKGVVPDAFYTLINKGHCTRWQYKEIKWFSQLRHRLDNPCMTDSPIHVDDVFQFQQKKSPEICGATPCVGWLVHVL
jgi:hypothetical protein